MTQAELHRKAKKLHNSRIRLMARINKLENRLEKLEREHIKIIKGCRTCKN